jgi:hypothetical protein
MPWSNVDFGGGGDGQPSSYPDMTPGVPMPERKPGVMDTAFSTLRGGDSGTEPQPWWEPREDVGAQIARDPAVQRMRGAAYEGFQGAQPQQSGIDLINKIPLVGPGIINPALRAGSAALGALGAVGSGAMATASELAADYLPASLIRDINLGLPAALAIGGADIPTRSGLGNMPTPGAGVPRNPTAPAPEYVKPGAVPSFTQAQVEARQNVRDAVTKLMDPTVSSPPASSPVPPPPAAGGPAPLWQRLVSPAQNPPPAPPPGLPTNLAEAQAATNLAYRANTAVGNRTLPGSVTNSVLDDLQRRVPTGMSSDVIRGGDPLTSLSADLEKYRDQPQTLAQLQQTYTKLGDAADAEYNAKTGYTTAGRDILQVQQNLRNQLAPPNVATDNPWTRALRSAQQTFKMEDLDRIQRQAANSDNEGLTIKNRASALLKDDDAMRGYSDDEKAALRDTVQSGYLGNTMRAVGSRLITPIATAAGMAGGSLVGDLTTAGMGAAAGGLLGEAIRYPVAEAYKGMQAKKLQDTINTVGGGFPPPVATGWTPRP